MSREQERIRKKLENNPIAECNKIQNRFCPELFSIISLCITSFALGYNLGSKSNTKTQK